MKFRITLIIIILSLIFTSCSGNGSKEHNKVKISLYKNDYSDYKIMDSVIKEIAKYAKERNIEIDIKTYLLSEISYDNIILKQNVDVFTGETDICFGTVNDLYALKKMNGDYTKIKTYENIMDNYKGEYCIPLAFDGYARFLNKEIFDEYDINNGNVITTLEYYECKQKMKSAGARFRLNEVEYMELVEYYALKYEFAIEKDNKVYLDKGNLKKALISMYSDLKENYDSFDLKSLDLENVNQISDTQIIDETTGIELFHKERPLLISNYSNIQSVLINNSKTVENCKMLLEDIKNLKSIPCVFISDKSNYKVYELVSVLFENEFAKEINRMGFTPSIDTAEVRELLNVDENWEYIAKDDLDKNKLGVDIINEYYKMLRDEDSRTYFQNSDFSNYFKKFLYFETIKVLEAPDYMNEIDKVIDKFEMNMQIQKN